MRPIDRHIVRNRRNLERDRAVQQMSPLLPEYAACVGNRDWSDDMILPAAKEVDRIVEEARVEELAPFGQQTEHELFQPAAVVVDILPQLVIDRIPIPFTRIEPCRHEYEPRRRAP